MPAQLIQSHISAQAQARHIFLSAEKRRIEARLAEINHERWLIRNGLWTGPITRHSTHSSASCELTGVNVQSFSDITQSCLPSPSMRPLNYRNLPQLLSGDDLEAWIAKMDPIIASFAEKIVCPLISEHCFDRADPISGWYSEKPEEFRMFTSYTGKY
jgi:hypothetical protein